MELIRLISAVPALHVYAWADLNMLWAKEYTTESTCCSPMSLLGEMQEIMTLKFLYCNMNRACFVNWWSFKLNRNHLPTHKIFVCLKRCIYCILHVCMCVSVWINLHRGSIRWKDHLPGDFAFHETLHSCGWTGAEKWGKNKAEEGAEIESPQPGAPLLWVKAADPTPQ